MHRPSAKLLPIAERAFRSGEIDRAEKLLRQILSSDPSSSRANELMAYIAGNRGDLECAFQHLRKATSDPRASPESWYYLGVYFQKKGLHESAVAAFARSLAIGGDFFEGLHDLGFSQFQLGHAAAAVDSYERAIAVHSGSFEAFYNKGRALDHLHRFDAALASYDTALEVNPQHVESWTNRGAALRDLGRPDEALASFDGALAISSGHVEAWSGRGVTLHDLQRLDEALTCFERASNLRPADAEILWRESFTRLAMGDFSSGWKKYEYRWTREKADPRRHGRTRAWLGQEPLRGKRVLAWSEQGYGDTIQFCRYAELLARDGGEVILEVQPPLQSLISASFPDCRVLAQGAERPECDFQIPLMSLPLAFDTRMETIPSRSPYLSADPRKIRHWRERLDLPGARMNIGIACSGSPAHRDDRHRTVALEEFAPLHEGANLYLIQKGMRVEDERCLQGADSGIRYLGDDMVDFHDSAAVIASMDLVISVDTSLAHLAGALGRPVWILLPWASDWRWLLDRTDSPWYPTATLFRQQRLEHWRDVMTRVREALAARGRP